MDVERSVPQDETSVTLVIFPGALGDCVCFLPTLRALRARRRGGRLILVAPAAVLPLLVRDGLGDEGVPIECAEVARLFVDGADLRDLVGSRCVGDVYSWLGSAEPPVRRNLAHLARGIVRCSRLKPPDGYPGHVARHFLSSAGVSAPVTTEQARLTFSPAESAVAGRFWRESGLAGHAVLALHRGAGSAAKRWVDEGHRAVARWWREEGGRVLEVAGPADPLDPLERSHALVRDRPLVEVAAVLSQADLVLGGDSGIVHLAGAVGLRGVALFGPTEPRGWRPLGGRIVCLKSRGRRTGVGPIPLEEISVGRVVRTLRCVQAAIR